MRGVNVKKWKYAISTADEAPNEAPILLQGDVCDNLKRAGELGYSAIELHTREDVEYDYEMIKAAEKESGVKLQMIITGRLNTEGKCNLIDDIPYVVDAAMTRMKDYIDMAEKVKADIVIGWAKGNIPAGKKRDKYIKRLADNLRILTQYASDRDVKINMEVINRYEVNIFTSADEIMEFIETYQIDNLYVHLDTFHMGIEETDSIAAIQRCRGKIGYVHLADNTRGYPSSGQFDFKKILETFEAVGYDGLLSVECLPRPDGLTAAKEAINYLKAIEDEG